MCSDLLLWVVALNAFLNYVLERIENIYALTLLATESPSNFYSLPTRT